MHFTDNFTFWKYILHNTKYGNRYHPLQKSWHLSGLRRWSPECPHGRLWTAHCHRRSRCSVMSRTAGLHSMRGMHSYSPRCLHRTPYYKSVSMVPDTGTVKMPEMLQININIQIIITPVTVNTCFDVQWGGRYVHIRVRVGDVIISNGAGRRGPLIPVSTPVSLGS